MARTARIGPMPTEQAVLVFWHEYNLAMFVAAYARRGHLPHASFSSQTERGTVIATIFGTLARRPGQVVLLPLPEERDRAAARDLAVRLGRLGAEGFSPVVTPDGPWGPCRFAKPGALIVARRSALPILPLAVRVRPTVRLRWRWDRQLIPLPFSHITVTAGSAISISPNRPLRPVLPSLQAALEAVTARAER